MVLQTLARQAPLSVGFSRQECWSGLPCPSPGDLPDPGIKPASLMSPALASRFFTTSATCKAYFLQGIFPTHRVNPGLPHCREILYHLSHIVLKPRLNLRGMVKLFFFHLALASFPQPNPGDKLLVSSPSLTPLEISFLTLMGQSLTDHKPNQVQPLSIL